jgi:phage terminase small subunit
MTKTLVRSKTQYERGVDLTPKQRLFVDALVRHGCTATKAAQMAGYSVARQAAYDLQHLPHVAAAIRLERQRYISGELANVATGTLREILIDKEAPASARVQAARTVLEMSGDIGKAKRTDDDDRPLSEMTADELARLIDKWTEEKAAMATAIDAQDVEIIDSAQAMAHLPAATRTPA